MDFKLYNKITAKCVVNLSWAIKFLQKLVFVTFKSQTSFQKFVYHQLWHAYLQAVCLVNFLGLEIKVAGVSATLRLVWSLAGSFRFIVSQTEQLETFRGFCCWFRTQLRINFFCTVATIFFNVARART
jgi:hypothetical protein